MDVKINPTSKLDGTIIAPGSKSYSHRAFIVASFADGVSVIRNPLISGDVSVTIEILKTLGVKVLEIAGNKAIVKSEEKSFESVNQVIDCGNSGTSIRIFSALALIIEGGLSLTGEFMKRKRPILPLLDSLKAVGGEYNLSGDVVNIKRVAMKCDKIIIQGDISSQFITALLILSTRLDCDKIAKIEIEITTPLISHPYVKITLDVLKSFGIKIIENLNDQKSGSYLIPCNQRFRPQVYDVPGDFSSAAFIIAAAVLSKQESIVTINNLDIESPQGDKQIIEILRKMGASIETVKEQNQIIIHGNLSKNNLKGIEINCNDIPDLFPILSVIGAFTKKTVLFNASNIRHKESDRVSAMARELTKMGVKVEEEEDKMTIYRCKKLSGSTIEHENDHRIAMACCIAAINAETSSQIKNIEIVKDSYPTFIKDLKKLGANIEILM
ncbi:MAG: 3-phosphoshikimate 1-carboxyvinyltransferase [Promethearchaeota archaeon]